jgi:hypothetical protein
MQRAQCAATPPNGVGVSSTVHEFGQDMKLKIRIAIIKIFNS